MPTQPSLTKLTWKDVRKEVAAVNPEFAKAIDALDPPKEFALFKAVYPYGAEVLKQAVLMLPNSKGQIVPITDDSIDIKVRQALDYNLNSNPVSMVLKNTFEIFLPFEDRTIPLYNLISPGSIFGTFRILNPQETQQPIFIWDMTAGSRSIFMLPKISEKNKHLKLQRQFQLGVGIPNSLMGHWEIFRQLANHKSFPEPWHAEILYFSKDWFRHLNDPAWDHIYYQLYRFAWKGSEFWRNQSLWNLIFSLILSKYEGKPSAYITDTVRYLMYAGIGARSGFAPAQDNRAAPIGALQKIYEDIYEIRNYPPIIMQPTIFNLYDQKSQPVYYSLQIPTALELGQSSRARPSFVNDLHEIRALLVRCEAELLSNKFNIKGTPMFDLFQKARYDYFHNNVELHSGMRSSTEIPNEDSHMLKTLDGKVHQAFPDMCAFVKGCIRISHKNSAK